jgi:hypothetical protein
MIARLLTIVGLLAVGFAGANLVDAGRTADWPPWARFTFAGGLLFVTVGAVALFHRVLSPAHSDLGPGLESDQRGPALRRGLLFGAGVLLAYFALGKALESFAGVPVERTLLVGFALGLAWATARKPWWFWDHWKAHILRQLVGDAATTVIYLAIATILLYLAILGDPGRVIH